MTSYYFAIVLSGRNGVVPLIEIADRHFQREGEFVKEGRCWPGCANFIFVEATEVGACPLTQFLQREAEQASAPADTSGDMFIKCKVHLDPPHMVRFDAGPGDVFHNANAVPDCARCGGGEANPSGRG